MFNKYVTSTTQQWQRNEPWLPATNAPVYQGSTWLKSSLEPLLEQRLCFQHCLVQSWTTCWPSPMQLPLPGCCSSHPGQQLHKAATSNPCSNSATNLIHNGHLCVLCYSMVWFIWVYIYTHVFYTLAHQSCQDSLTWLNLMSFDTLFFASMHCLRTRILRPMAAMQRHRQHGDGW